MCGRFVLTKAPKDVAEFFDVGNMPELRPRYNIAPTQDVFAVLGGDGGRAGALFRWGLTPPWGDGKLVLTNARADGVATKPAFRSAFKKRRCLVPADGFYEWLTQGKRKTPHLFTADGGLFAIAGLYEDTKEDLTPSACLITTEANEVVGAVHDRMPVILPRKAWAAWLDPNADAPWLQALLRPYPASLMSCRAVSDYVSSSRNEGARCWDPPAATGGYQALAQGSLF